MHRGAAVLASLFFDRSSFNGIRRDRRDELGSFSKGGERGSNSDGLEKHGKMGERK